MTRIRITGGPWKQRIGCEGNILEPPDRIAARRYPWAGLAPHERVILLDDDPLGIRPSYTWTCVMHASDLELLDEGRTDG